MVSPLYSLFTMTDPIGTVGNDMNLMKLILGFHGENSYLYTGILSREHKKLCGTTFTSRHYVGKSRRRISREIWKDQGVKFITECMMSSAKKGDLKSIKRIDLYCRRSNIRLLTSRLRNPMVSAASSGDLPTIQWMHRHGFAMGPITMLAASRATNASSNIKWLIDKGCEFEESSEEELARRGDVPALKVLRSRKGLKGFSENVLMNALSCGPWPDSSIIEYLIEDGCRLNSNMMCSAASVGDIESIRVLWNHMCPYDERVCWFASLGRHLDVVQELRSYSPPCPWDFSTIRVAVHNKDLKLLRFCIQEQCPGYLYLLNHY